MTAPYPPPPTETYDIGDRCVYCGESTAPGSGRFVNRLGADADVMTNSGRRVMVDGWACAECWAVECDRCGERSHEWGCDPLERGEVWCDDCTVAVMEEGAPPDGPAARDAGEGRQEGGKNE